MSFDIFRVDWILIDSIISVILIFILVGVNILKKLRRWRLSLSNENLERLIVKPSLYENFRGIKRIKRWTITYPKDKIKIDELSTIIIIRTFRRFMLLTALTEGLSSYGFKVFNFWIKKHIKSKLYEDLDKFMLSDILKYQYNDKLKLNTSYFLLVSSKIPFETITQLVDPSNLGIIILNPTINCKYYLNLSKNFKFYGIFNEKIAPFIRNPNLKKFLKSQRMNEIMKFRVIKGAKPSFKYYETILLSELIKIIKHS
ncbi:MAG: hypothetical protein ACFFKA_07360 [Candidatus Thorarchaeota archaeon]